ncbi:MULTISPECIES: hypothetical protein [unclassified Nocardiopsis]|uniref:hypothetical protein n=1 Tax=unclassified Nocardiopsis TaxID=2649073 RepID=UPI0013581EAF|nr:MULTISPECIES: hypothetical protein [unclassified Nocardiopsis]
MVEEKAPPQKQGLHGWKAAAAVFGGGTLAAFGVFGVLLGLASMFFNFTSSGMAGGDEGSGGNPAERIGEARSSLEEGEMNVCEDNIEYLSSVNVTRQDGNEDYVDTASGGQPEIEGAERVVRDECLWTIVPSSGSSLWDFHFSYEAVIDAEEGEAVEEVAASRYAVLKSELASNLTQVDSEGDAGFGDKSHSVYGTGEQGQSVYIALVQTKSAVYQIRFDDRTGSSVGTVSENEFKNEARKVSSFLGYGFEYWIPE